MKSNLKIVHIAPDEKFINFANDFFEDTFPQKNIFYIVNYNKQHNFTGSKYVEQRDNVKIVFTIEEMVKICQENSTVWDVIFFHSVVPNLLPIFTKIDDRCKKLWFCFGFEVYNDPSFFPLKKLYFKNTFNNFINKNNTLPKLDKIKDNKYLRRLYRTIKPSLYLSEEEKIALTKKNKLKLIDQIDYLVSSFDEEYTNIKTLLHKPQLKPFIFWYSTVEKSDIEDSKSRKKENIINILIGNSATPICNHADVLAKIKNLNITHHNINLTIPLSYGGGMEYINFVKENHLTSNYHIEYIERFMTLDEYKDLLAEFQIAIIASRRQHAVSTAIILLTKGVKLFLSEDNPFYHYLKRIGVYVYSYEKDLTATSLFPLSPEQVGNNQQVLHKLLNKQYLAESLRKQMSNVLSN